jgi:hypothetical protein
VRGLALSLACVYALVVINVINVINVIDVSRRGTA